MFAEAPGASVIVITYNHARFLAEAVDSIAAHQTGFPFEIIISEDCSTDDTRDVGLGDDIQKGDARDAE